MNLDLERKFGCFAELSPHFFHLACNASPGWVIKTRGAPELFSVVPWITGYEYNVTVNLVRIIIVAAKLFFSYKPCTTICEIFSNSVV